ASLMRRLGYRLPDLREKEKGAIRFALAVKLAPGVPAFVKNYAMGLAGVPFAVYLGVAMLITGAYGVALVLLGESLLQHELNRALPLVVAVAAIALATFWWRRRRLDAAACQPA